MCRNIKTLFNFEPPATEAEIRASALQFVRKLSGFNKPSKANEDAFNRAVVEVTSAASRLIFSLETSGEPRNREVEAEKAKERSQSALRLNGPTALVPNAHVDQMAHFAAADALSMPCNAPWIWH